MVWESAAGLVTSLRNDGDAWIVGVEFSEPLSGATTPELVRRIERL